jgi:F-type H+-transporting ATPase subunit epsilon
MKLTVRTPVETVLDEDAMSVVAEGLDGSFCLRSRHIDCVAALVPGLFYFEPREGQGRYLAVDRGLLIKRGDAVSVSVRHAVAGGDLADLLAVVETRFKVMDEQERVARSAVARLESDFLRRFMELS